MNLLNDCADDVDANSAVHVAVQPPAVESVVGGVLKRNSANLNALRNITVQAMSNLLNANIDSGLMHAIGKPHVDISICSILLFVFSVVF